jgi:hypothetical protein
MPCYTAVLLFGLVYMLKGKQVAAGIIFALCSYKFNLLVLLPVVFALKGQRRCFYTVVLGTVGAAIGSASLASPASYLAMLRSIPIYSLGFMPAGVRGLAIIMHYDKWYYPLADRGRNVRLSNRLQSTVRPPDKTSSRQ